MAVLEQGTQAFVRSLSGELKMPGMKRPSAADMGEKGDQGQGGRNRKSKKGGESQTEAEDNTLVKSLAGCPKPREIPSFATKERGSRHSSPIGAKFMMQSSACRRSLKGLLAEGPLSLQSLNNLQRNLVRALGR